MKKMNNKGFAISTLLYGLLLVGFMVVTLLMSIMATNRKNTSTLVKKIEEELNRYSETATEFTSTDGAQEYIVPYGKSGWYKIELWGAGGYGATDTSGKGAYTSGIIFLAENTHLYFYIGGAGTAPCKPYTNCIAAHNGGGLGGHFGTLSSGSLSQYQYGSGGGATDVRLVGGSWNDATSLNNRIMVAAGGGSTDSINTGSNGGGLIGEPGTTAKKGAVAGKGGTQKSAGTGGDSSVTGSFGRGGIGQIPYSTQACCNDAFGGGGGYFGGAGGYSGNPHNCTQPCEIRGYSGGGSSYISGYAGVNSITSETNRNPSNQTRHWNGSYYFINGLMVPGVNKNAGKAKIELISTERPPIIMDHVRYVKDCITTSNTNGGYEHWSEIQVISTDGINLAKSKPVTYNGTVLANSPFTDGDITPVNGTTTSSTIGEKCILVDLGANYNVGEIAVFHHKADNNNYSKETLSVSSNGTDYFSKISWDNLNTSVTEDSNGIRYTEIRATSVAPHKAVNYYLFSALSNNLVLNLSGTNATLDLFSASKKQKWTVEDLGGFYKIINNDTSFALQPADGGLESGENVNASTQYGNHAWEQWYIESLKNGYSRLKSKANANYCLASNTSTKNPNQNVVIAPCSTAKNQQFKLVSADY